MRVSIKWVNPTGSKHSATVLFLHGSGSSGNKLLNGVHHLLGREMSFPHIRIVYPTAPAQKYTAMGGDVWNIWFDRYNFKIATPENKESLAKSYRLMERILQAESDRGIPPERIIVGGFSMGGTMALHLGYHLRPELAGVFACSSFLNSESIVYETLRLQNHYRLPALLMFHGEQDNVVPFKWGKRNFDRLVSLGVMGTFVPLKNAYHELQRQELQELENWFLRMLPE